MRYSTVGCLVTLTLGMLVAPLLAVAQPVGKVPTIGFLNPRFCGCHRAELRSLHAMPAGVGLHRGPDDGDCAALRGGQTRAAAGARR